MNQIEKIQQQGLTQVQIDRRVFDLYDEYCHGRIGRREFFARSSAITVAGVSGLAMAEALLPRYARAQTISFTDSRIKAQYVTWPSPGGGGLCAATSCSPPARGLIRRCWSSTRTAA